VNILVLIPSIYDTSPAQRFRIEQWARYLDNEGCRFTFIPFENEPLNKVLYQPRRYFRKAALMLMALCRRITLLAEVRRFDVVFVPREASSIGPAVIERLVLLLGVPLVYDFDDPIFLPYRSPNNRFFNKLKCRGKVAALCRMATRVVAGNRLLGDWARQYSNRVDVIPSTIDLDYYPPSRPRNEESDLCRPLVLGWTGSHSTLPFLDAITSSLNVLARSHRFVVKVISHTDDYRVPGAEFQVISQRWRASTESNDLQEFDIGLGPFPDSGWTPWRCHGKILQYMAAGLPCVASNIGILSDYIRNGVNGFLAHDSETWVEKLSRLIVDPCLRRRLGDQARETIEKEYSAAVWAPRLYAIFEEAVRHRRNRVG